MRARPHRAKNQKTKIFPKKKNHFFQKTPPPPPQPPFNIERRLVEATTWQQHWKRQITLKALTVA